MLEVRDLFKTYEGKPLLNNISFHVEANETICLLGASGSGKSTLLRIIAGLEEPDAGRISFADHDLANVPPHLRDFGLVFQDYALFPHLNVYDNVAFGLKMRRMSQSEIVERVANSLDTVNMKGFEKRDVTELSGGEQQRVALARALAIRPRLLMFDEPLGALDRALREDLLAELRAILHRTQVPAIYVTHDQEEAFTIADRVLILHEGEIIREGTPSEVWANPKSAYVANLLGLGEVVEGEVRERMKDGKWKIGSVFGIHVVGCAHIHQRGEKVHLLARPLTADSIRVERREPIGERSAALSLSKGRNAEVAIHGVVADVIFQQDRYKVRLDNSLYIYLNESPKMGQKISARVKVECLA